MRYLPSSLLIIILSYSLLTDQAKAQVSDTLKAYNNLIKAKKFYRESRNYDSAYYFFEKAAEEYEKAGVPDQIPACKLGSGNAAFTSGNYKLAATRYEEAKATATGKDISPVTMSGIYNNLGAAYEQLGKRYLAKTNLEKGLKIREEHFGPNHRRTASSYANLGTSYTYFGEYQRGLDFYLKALPIYLENFGEKSSKLSALYVNIGILYDKKRDYKHAIDYYLKANEIDKNAYGEDYMYSAYNYHNLGISYHNMHRDSLAIKSLHKAIALSAKNNLFELHASSIYELGQIHQNNEQYNRALDNYRLAINIITGNFGNDHPKLNYYYSALSDIKRLNKEYTEAEDYLHKAINVNKKNYGDQHANIAGNLNGLAHLYNVQGQYDSALSAADKGLKIIYSGKKFDPGSPVFFNEVLDHHRFLSLLQTKAGILIDRYDPGSQDIEDLKYALSCFQTANELIDHVRRGYITESSKIFLQNRASFIYDEAISLCLKLHSITKEDQYLSEALLFSEKSKATVLAEALQASNLTVLQGIPDSILVLERSLKEQILMAENNFLKISHQESDRAEAVKRKDILFRLKRSYDSLTQKISQSYPDYYDLKYTLEVVKAETAKNWLDDRSAILSYFIGEENIYVFAITNQGIDVNAISLDTFDLANLKTFREKIVDENQRYESFADLSFRLYHDLVEKPLSGRQHIDRLIIIPDGVLNYIPFDALITEKMDNGSFIPNYLIKSYAVSYANSLSLLIHQPKKIPEAQINYIGFAPGYSGDGNASYRNIASEGVLLRLGGALEEVKSACETLDGEIYIENEASEYNFKNITQQPAILHLAMHATLDDKDPMRSKLLFTKEADTVEDGNLNAYEIYNLKLTSQLAVLSACNTGYGEIQRGEGIMSLSRAFKYSGCPNIVMSLWRARDQPSNKIIGQLFINLKKKMPKDEALRQAKLTYLKGADPLQAHPANWATLVLVGNTEPMQLIQKQNWLQIALISGVLVALFMLIARKYYSRKYG